MALKDIMAISGQPGLFKFVSQGRNGIIVESLTDGKRTHVSASAKVSALSDIAIFTNDGEKPLREVLEKIKEKENGGPTIPHKSSNDELKKFFIQVVPDFDAERVYVSDIKKVVAWYNQLQTIGMLDFAEEVEETPESSADEQSKKSDEETAETAPAKKKSTTKKATTDKKPNIPKRAPAPKGKPGGGEAVQKKSPRQKKS